MRGMLNDLPVIHEPLPAAFTPESGFLVAAEWRRRIELVERVSPHDARLQQRAHLENARALVGPDTGRESVHRVVRFLDRFLERAERQNAQHRSEDFLARDAMALRDACEHSRLEVVTLRRKLTHCRLVHLGAGCYARVDELADPVELRLRVDRAYVGVLVERI